LSLSVVLGAWLGHEFGLSGLAQLCADWRWR
jgi:hypothetical protein